MDKSEEKNSQLVHAVFRQVVLKNNQIIYFHDKDCDKLIGLIGNRGS